MGVSVGWSNFPSVCRGKKSRSTITLAEILVLKNRNSYILAGVHLGARMTEWHAVPTLALYEHISYCKYFLWTYKVIEKHELADS